MIWIVHFISINLLLLISKLIKKDKFFIYSSFFYALFVFGQRWMTGTDFPNYLRYYLTDFPVREPIYRVLQDSFASHNLYFGWLIFIVFFITIFNNYRFFLKLEKHVVLMVYIYVFSEIFFAQMSQIRQFAAISFFINAFFYAYERKYSKSFINFILGTGFHTSIIFLIPFLFIKLNITRIKAVYLLIAAAVLPLFDATLLLKIPFFARYSHYIKSVYNVGLSPFHLMKFYLLVVLVFIYIWNLKRYRQTPVDQMILNGILWSMLIYGLSFQFAPMIRINSYFKIFEIVFLVYYLTEVENLSKILAKTGVVLFFYVTFLGLMVTDPYKITRYEFKPLKIYEEKTVDELYKEINNF